MLPSSGRVPSAPGPPLKRIQYRGYATFPSKVALFSALRLSLSPLLSFYRFGVDVDLILEALGPRKYSKFNEKVIIFKHFEVFASKPSPKKENEPKSPPKTSKTPPKPTQSSPGEAKSSP